MNTAPSTTSTTPFDVPQHTNFYKPLEAQPKPADSLGVHQRPIKILSMVFISTLLLMSTLIVLVIFTQQSPQEATNKISSPKVVLHGASEKSYRQFTEAEVEAYLRGNDNVSWQRTAYHFHPPNNFMCGTYILINLKLNNPKSYSKF